ncbi:hypothetical protein O0L34_g15116 [Tuta absoluta]|nr:hypothetical protein O0L34_g15116 [Tuta absoluta]
MYLWACVSGYANVFTYEKKVNELFKFYAVVPDVVPKAPEELAFVIHPNGVEAILGNEVTPTFTNQAPAVAWNAKPEHYYTLAMVDPDVPSRAAPTDREWLHWLVGNIHGTKGNLGIEGDILAEYVGPAPGPHSDLHRYVFLVYQQTGKLVFDEPRLNNTSAAGRTKFSTTAFAKKYKLGDPVSGNFYRARYDDYAPLIRAQLGDNSLLYCLTGEVKCD